MSMKTLLRLRNEINKAIENDLFLYTFDAVLEDLKLLNAAITAEKSEITEKSDIEPKSLKIKLFRK